MRDSPDNSAPKRDRLKQLRAFCGAARLESIARAAHELSLSQPSVSQQVRALEKELSVKLFERRGPRIILSPAGKSLYDLAMPLLLDMDRLPEIFSERFVNSLSGKVHIVAGLTSAVYILPFYLKAFQTRHPSVRIRVTNVGGCDMMAALHTGTADFGIGALDFPPCELEFHSVRSSSLVLIAPPHHPLVDIDKATPEQITHWPIILPPPGTYGRQVADYLGAYFGIRYDVALETTGWSILKRYVESDLGIAFVPDLCLTSRDKLRVIPVSDSIARLLRPRHYGLIHSGRKLLSAAAGQLIDLIKCNPLPVPLLSNRCPRSPCAPLDTAP